MAPANLKGAKQESANSSRSSAKSFENECERYYVYESTEVENGQSVL
jgi:hypothetical protein